MSKYSIGDLLIRNKDEIYLDDIETYKRVTVRLYHKGVIIRDIVKGSDIKTKKQYRVKKGQFIMSRIDARNGAFGIIPEDLDGAVISSDFLTFDVNKKLSHIEYFQLYTQTNVFLDACIKGSAGTTNRKRLKEEIFLNFQTEFPNIDQQIKFFKKYNSTKLKDDLIKDELRNQKKLCNDLRQSILQEAVQGKLVPQDPNDEPASELLKKIKADKEKLVKEVKIKRQKPLPSVSEDEIPYELPEGWVWCRLGEVSKNIHYGFTASADFTNSEFKLLRITDIQDNKVLWENVPGCEVSEKKFSNYELKNNDIVIARTGGTIGKTFLIKNLKLKAVFASYLIRLIPSSLFNKSVEYLKYFLESPIYWEQLYEKSKGTGQPNVNATSLTLLRFPLPPLDEQKRIVSKVDELMKLCDEMEKNIEQSKKDSELLMRAVLQEAFEG